MNNERWAEGSGGLSVVKSLKKNYLATAACANLPLQAITWEHIKAILAQPMFPFRKRGPRNAPQTENKRPFWKARPRMAKKTQVFLSGMFRHYKHRGQYLNDNPADARRHTALYDELGRQPPGESHQDLRVDEVPVLVAFLRKASYDPNVITSEQLAQASGRDRETLRKLRKRGVLRGHKEPGKGWNTASYVYTLADVEKAGLKLVNPITMSADEYLYSNIEEMVILTGARVGMVCELKWSEIKPRYQNSVQGMIIWNKHKTRRFGYIFGTVITSHIQRIFDDMRERCRRFGLPAEGDAYVFPHGPTKVGEDRWFGRRVGPGTMEQFLQRQLAQIKAIETKNATNHGFRTTFTTWACDTNDYQEKLAMVTIGHTFGNQATEEGVFRSADAVYLRNAEKLKKRWEMMTKWGDYVYSQIKRDQHKDRKVVPIRPR
jgi:integrase